MNFQPRVELYLVWVSQSADDGSTVRVGLLGDFTILATTDDYQRCAHDCESPVTATFGLVPREMSCRKHHTTIPRNRIGIQPSSTAFMMSG